LQTLPLLQFALDRHSTHAFVLGRQYRCPPQFASPRHSTHTPRVGAQYGWPCMQAAFVVQPSAQRLLIGSHTWVAAGQFALPRHCTQECVATLQ
jgi:hypothetical protein